MASGASAFGAGSQALGVNSTAVGRGSYASGASGTATGAYSMAVGQGSSVYGQQSWATYDGASAYGAYSWADTPGATAIGTYSYVSGLNSVALGANSYAGEDNTVSIGAVGSERRIVNVADGVGETDGVNVRQLTASSAATLSAANAYSDARSAAALSAANAYTDERFNALDVVLDRRLGDMDDDLRRVGAMSAALAVMAGNTAGQGTGAANRLVVGVGGYGGEGALSVGYSRTITPYTAVNIGVSATSGGGSMGGGSLGFAW